MLRSFNMLFQMCVLSQYQHLDVNRNFITTFDHTVHTVITI